MVTRSDWLPDSRRNISSELCCKTYGDRRSTRGSTKTCSHQRNFRSGRYHYPIIGGRTGRDGCGGATGSSKVHTEESIETCGAEVQKGNAPTERKIQRLFRREEVSKLIKKCNDFGAGGVSVAIGELADGLQIDLDKVPKKYAGLDGTEIAISESQERMAVVVDPKDVDEFMKYATEENLEATKVAVVTEDPRLVLSWRGKEIVNLSRAFLDTNGAHQETTVAVDIPNRKDHPRKRRSKRRKRKMAWYVKRPECMLTERSGRNVRRIHRSSFCIHAARWKISEDRDAEQWLPSFRY